MPYKSEKQRRYLHAKEPELARKWDKKYGGKVQKSYTPVFKSDDPDFNQKAAQAAFDLVMKMDDAEAEVFTQIVVSDVLEMTIEKNLRTLQGHLDRVISKRIRELKRATARASVAKRAEDVVPFAHALSMIEKSQTGVAKAKNPYDLGYRFKESDFNRNPNTGRFQTKIVRRQTKPLSERTARSLGVRGMNDQRYKDLTTRQKAQYQDEYRQLADFLGAVHQSTGDPGNSQVILHFQDKMGNRFAEVHTGTRPPNEMLYDPDVTLTGAEARPTTLTFGGAAFGLTSALGGRMGDQRVGQLNRVDQGFNSFAADWTQAQESVERPNDRMYSRLATGSQFVNDVSLPGSKLQTAARFGQFVGSHGAEAEAVIGPSARKTAYRYRGTERQPDAKLVRDYATAINGAKARSVHGQDLSMVQQAAQRVQNERRDPTFAERQDGRSEIVSYLNSKGVRPSGKLYNLQLASGNTPPSEGVILDAQGRIAAQAVGYGDDHYLPFNLKNLKALKGGEYIRNRSVGGPTSEDIYTGLIAGARQVTVTSRSGTFVVTFKEDFRGGRRHNDKARRMVRRYEQLLDAVQSKQVDNVDIDPRMRDAITHEVRERAHPAMKRAEIQAEIQRQIDEYKSSPEITEEEDERINFLVAREQRHGDQRTAEELRTQLTNELAADKEYKYRLNGPGYAAALEALREQFPYYIDVRYVPTRYEEFVPLGLDRGYVEPGRNRPTAARAGLYGTKKNEAGELKGTKISAANADYQGARVERKGGTPVSNAPEEEEGATVPAAPQAPRASGAHAARQVQAQANYEEAAVALRNQLATRLTATDISAAGYERAAGAFRGDDAEFRTWLANPDNQSAWHELTQVNAASFSEVAPTELATYKQRSNWVGRAPFDPQLAHQWSPQPARFEGPAYELGATESEIAEEMRKIKGSTPGIVNTVPLESMTDAELEQEVRAVGSVRQQLAGVNRADLSYDDLIEILERLPKDSPTLRQVTDVEGMGRYLEQVQRVRALNAGKSERARAAEARAAGPGDIVVTNPFDIPKSEQRRMYENTAMLRLHMENQPDHDDIELERLRSLENALDENRHGQVNLDDVKAAHPEAWEGVRTKGVL